jgi:hypothetical protein
MVYPELYGYEAMQAVISHFKTEPQRYPTVNSSFKVKLYAAIRPTWCEM